MNPACLLSGHGAWERSPYCGSTCRGHCARCGEPRPPMAECTCGTFALLNRNGHCAPCAEEARRLTGLGCLALLAVSGVCWALVLALLAGLRSVLP